MTICPVCNEPAPQYFVTIPQAPVHCNLLWSERDAALAATRGDIALAYCPSCGHVFNEAFDPALMEYTQAYENSLHFSPRFQTYAESLAGDLVERYDIRGKELVEIGAGQGDFLRLLCALGDNRGIGFDAAYVPGEADDGDERVRFIGEFDWQAHIDAVPDMIYTRHVLEHIERPSLFLEGIREVIGDDKNTLVFFEMPNMSYTLRELAIWDIIYEHCGYFSSYSLSCLFTRAGFNVLDTHETFGGQFLTIEALPAAAPSTKGCATADALQEMQQQVNSFAAEFEQKVADWQSRLAAWAAAGKTVVAWGAGSKGVTFLNVLQTQDQIRYIVDINPRKRGMFVVGSGQEIVPPEFMREVQPDVVILMNPLYREEIAQTMADLGLKAEFVIA